MRGYIGRFRSNMKYLSYLFAVFLTLSCKRDRQHAPDNKKSQPLRITATKTPVGDCIPDTVNIGQHYNGRILYSAFLIP